MRGRLKDTSDVSKLILNQNKMKQTAVEWLIEQLHLENSQINKPLFEQAKVMEKEQHKKTWSEGMFSETGDIQAFEQYYNETFKSE